LVAIGLARSLWVAWLPIFGCHPLCLEPAYLFIIHYFHFLISLSFFIYYSFLSCDARLPPSLSGAPLARRGGQVAVADTSAKIWLSSASESYAFRFPLTLGSSRRAYGGRNNPGNAFRSRFPYEKVHFLDSLGISFRLQVSP